MLNIFQEYGNQRPRAITSTRSLSFQIINAPRKIPPPSSTLAKKPAHEVPPGHRRVKHDAHSYRKLLNLLDPQTNLMREAGEEITSERAAIAEQFAGRVALNLNEQGMLVPVDSSDFAIARYFHEVHRDLEDDFILAAVERSGANYLVTGDKQLRNHAPVAALAPDDLLTLLNTIGDA